jgi:hypothetical protein
MDEAHVQRQVQFLHHHTLHLFGVIISHLKQSQVKWNIGFLHHHTLNIVDIVIMISSASDVVAILSLDQLGGEWHRAWNEHLLDGVWLLLLFILIVAGLDKSGGVWDPLVGNFDLLVAPDLDVGSIILPLLFASDKWLWRWLSRGTWSWFLISTWSKTVLVWSGINLRLSLDQG